MHAPSALRKRGLPEARALSTAERARGRLWRRRPVDCRLRRADAQALRQLSEARGTRGMLMAIEGALIGIEGALIGIEGALMAASLIAY